MASHNLHTLNISSVLQFFSFSVLLHCVGFSVLAQSPLPPDPHAALPRVSNYGQHVVNLYRNGLLETERRLATDKMQPPVFQRNGKTIVDCFIEVDTTIVDSSALQRLGVFVSPERTDIWSANMPIEALEKVPFIRGVKHVEVNPLAYPLMDSARRVTGVSLIHAGADLPRPYTGRGIIMGIVDGGFDPFHPAFQEQNSTRLRISRVWDQIDTIDKRPPTGYNYGTEYVGESQILGTNRVFGGSGSHGTHVSGIAAGSGKGSMFDPQRFIGNAPDAELVWVNVNWGNGIIDGVAYIIRYAESVGKPVVINLSIGGNIGPRDGTSAFDRRIMQLVGRGKVVVGAAGNNGDEFKHTYKELRGDTLRTFFALRKSETLGGGKGGSQDLEMLGSRNSNFSLGLEIRDSLGAIIARPERIVYPMALGQTSFQDSFYLERNGQIDSFFVIVNLSSALSNFNAKPSALVRLSTTNMAGINATVWVSSANCNVHVWNAGGARLSNTLPNGTIMPDFNDGDNLYTIAEVGGTGRATLSNGNLTSQTHFIDVKGRTQRAWSESRLFQMATYSSRGPDTDNRTKPDVASPGHVVVAPVSHTETFGDSSYTISILEANGRTFGYMPFGGTSMASPNCAGAVALLLEADSSLTAEEVKQIVIQTANKDSYTGATPNPAYGNGKLYAYSALQEVLRRLVARAPFPESVPLRIYPNPAQDLVHILVPVSKQTAASIFIYDATGRVVSSYSEQLYPTESSAVKLGHLPAGVYSLTVQTPEASWQQKLVITR